MFVWAYNSNKFLVNENGRVKNHNRVTVRPKIDLEGNLYVEYGKARFYIAEMVLANHGKPPHKNRLPRAGEVPVFLDDDKTNVDIKNLEWGKAEKGSKGNSKVSRVTDQLEDYVWDLLKQGYTYFQIQEKVAKSSLSGNNTVSHSQIAQIRRDKSEEAAKNGNLLPSEKLGLDAVKKSLGESDDAEARRQQVAQEDAKKRKSELAKKAKKEAEAEINKEATDRVKEIKTDIEGKYSIGKEGGGWYGIYKGSEKLNGKNLREKDAQIMVDTLKEGGEKADEILEALAIDKASYDR